VEAVFGSARRGFFKNGVFIPGESQESDFSHWTVLAFFGLFVGHSHGLFHYQQLFLVAHFYFGFGRAPGPPTAKDIITRRSGVGSSVAIGPQRVADATACWRRPTPTPHGHTRQLKVKLYFYLCTSASFFREIRQWTP
jgi:hypothetical protein